MAAKAITEEKQVQKLEKLENSIEELKAMVKMALKVYPKKSKIVKLAGALKGMEVTQEDIEEAEKSVFPYEK